MSLVKAFCEVLMEVIGSEVSTALKMVVWTSVTSVSMSCEELSEVALEYLK